MSSTRFTVMLCGIVMQTASVSHSLGAQPSVGTWVRQGADPAATITMTIEKCCGGGRRLTYRLSGGKHVMTVESPFDGTEVPVLFDGKPSGQTMAIKLVDSRHTVTTTKLNGKPMGVSKATLSADGKTLTVVNDMSAAGATQGQAVQTETWIKK